jgi:putative SOS response-associated peptidase YedK
VLVNGFFEWQTQGKAKVPYFIYLKNEESFAIGGIWDVWINPENGEVKRTFSIVTTTANPLMARIHNHKERMPLILEPRKENEWLNTTDEKHTVAMIRPFSDLLMSAHPVSKLVNGRSGNPNVAEVQNPVAIEPTQGSLF